MEGLSVLRCGSIPGDEGDDCDGNGASAAFRLPKPAGSVAVPAGGADMGGW